MNIEIFYNNNSLGQSIRIVYDDVAHTIVSGAVVSYNALYPGYFVGDVVYEQALSGISYQVIAQNSTPFAYVTTVSNSCAVSITLATVVNADTPISADGSIIVTATGNQPVLSYYLFGGPDSLNILQSGNQFNGLKAGTYQIKVATQNFFTGVSCETALQTVVVPFDTLTCDLVLGTVTTTLSPGATLTIVNYLTSLPEPVEYRLDAGAWQNSNIFTGLAAGVRNVQVRFRNFPACVASRNVTISAVVACTLTLSNVVVAPEQSKFAKNGALTILATGASGAVTYQIVGPSGTISNGTGAFNNLRPGRYDITITDAAGCQAFDYVIVPFFRVPIVDIPTANAMRLILASGPVADTRFQTYDNTLLKSMRFPFEKETACYLQKVTFEDTTVIQWRSSYSNFVAELIKSSDNSLISILPAVKRTSYLDNEVVKDGIITTGVTGFTQLFFTDGLPGYYQVGGDVTLTGAGAMDGTYEIKDILPGILLAAGYQVLLLEVSYSLVPTTDDCTVTSIYDIEDWEVWEATIGWSAFVADEYFVRLTATDVRFQPTLVLSEPILLAAAHDDTLLIEYSNTDNAFRLDYTSLVNKLRVPARIGLPRNGGTVVGMEDSVRRYIKLNENVTRFHDFELWDVPFYVMEKVALAFAHDKIFVNGVQYATEEKLEATEFEMEVLMNGRARLRQVTFENENQTDASAAEIMSVLTIENVLIDCGPHNASTDLYPSLGGTGFGGAVKRGNWFIVTVASTPDVNGDIKFPLGCTMQALIDNPGQIDSNWKVVRA